MLPNYSDHGTYVYSVIDMPRDLHLWSSISLTIAASASNQ